MLGLWAPADVLERHLVLLLASPLAYPLRGTAQSSQEGGWQVRLATHLRDDMLDERLAQVVASVSRYDL